MLNVRGTIGIELRDVQVARRSILVANDALLPLRIACVHSVKDGPAEDIHPQDLSRVGTAGPDTFSADEVIAIKDARGNSLKLDCRRRTA